MKETVVRSKAPAKIILTGEHAVVYGCPAIAMAVNRFATTEVYAAPREGVSFILSDIATTLQLTCTALKAAHRRLVAMYRRFVAGNIHISDVVSAPADLFQFALQSLVEQCQVHPQGIRVQIQSSIPIGCGMGSSAATVASFVNALMHFFGIHRKMEWLERFLLEVERLQHGTPSGLDSFMSLHGGCVLFQSHNPPVRLPSPTIPLWLVMTGTPESSTGACVSAVASTWSTSMKTSFAAVTEAFCAAMKEQDQQALIDLIRHNHRLLVQLGVVPFSVQRFIHAVERVGGAAKISGAGSISGEAAGVVLALAPHAELAALCAQFGYSVCPVELEASGATVYRS